MLRALGEGLAPGRSCFAIHILRGSGVFPAIRSAVRLRRTGLGVGTCTLSYFAGFPGIGTWRSRWRFDMAPESQLEDGDYEYKAQKRCWYRSRKISESDISVFFLWKVFMWKHENKLEENKKHYKIQNTGSVFGFWSSDHTEMITLFYLYEYSNHNPQSWTKKMVSFYIDTSFYSSILLRDFLYPVDSHSLHRPRPRSAVLILHSVRHPSRAEEGNQTPFNIYKNISPYSNCMGKATIIPWELELQMSIPTHHANSSCWNYTGLYISSSVACKC